MKALLFLSLFLLFSGAFAQVGGVFQQSDLQQMEQSLKSMNPNEYRVPGINNFQIIMVGGFLGELSNEYLEANEKAVRTMGAEHVLRIQPDSRNSVDANIEILKTQILAEYEKNKKPIILWGHSKGGVESLGLILRYPELVRSGVIKLVVPIQSPVGGCVGGTCASLSMFLSRTHTAFDGMHSLSTAAIDRVITKRIDALDTETRQMLSDATVFVVSHQDPRRVDTVLQFSAFGLSAIGQENDALVAEKAMSVRNFGRVIGRVIADHMQMVMVATRGIAKRLLTTGTLESVYGMSFLLMSQAMKHIDAQNAKYNQCILLFK